MTVVAVLLGVLVIIILFMAVRLGRIASAGPRRTPAMSVVEGHRAIVVLDVGDIDAHSVAAGRLVDDAANRAFVSLPDVTEVEVRTATSLVLGTRQRETPREIAIPGELYEPPALARAGPDLSGLSKPSGAGVLPRVSREDLDAASPHRPVADRFDLPASVRDSLGDDDDDAVMLVVAILEAAGHRVERDGELLQTGDTALVVIRTPIGEPVPADLLSQAFRRFEASGAARGLVVTPGFMDPTDVRRREVLAPVVLHAGPDGIQRMADAVALGCDPVRFAAAPPLSTA